MVLAEDRIRLKRAYEAAERGDGTRILVDRLWPRGVKKSDAAIDHWMKEVAPTTALRVWFGHDPARWKEFRTRYAAELRDRPEAIATLRALAEAGPVTLVYAARDEARHHALVLREVLTA